MLKGFVSGMEKDITRIPMLVGNEYKEGWEVRDNQDRLIWGREDELQTTTGSLKLKGYGLPVKVKSLLGNGVQNGTPAPDAPIEPEFCGERTGNLWNGVEYIKTSLSSSETWTYSEDLAGSVYRVPCKPNTTYTLYLTENISLTLWRIRDVSTDAVPTAQSTSVQIAASHAESVPSGNSTTFTTSQNAKYILFQTNASLYSSVLNCIMLIEGSTIIPYEPYGWKISFENHGVNLAPPVNEWVDGYISGSNGAIVPPGEVYIEKSSDYLEISNNITNVAFSGDDGEFEVGSSGAWRAIGFYDSDKTFVSRLGGNGSNAISVSIPDGARFMRISCRTYGSDKEYMLNTSRTALPYSPYLNETTPVYLGQTPTVRRIRKLVLDGTERWLVNWRPATGTYAALLTDSTKKIDKVLLCTHLELKSYDQMYYTDTVGISTVSGSTYLIAIRVPDAIASNDTEFKAWLAAQYAAGTPVTVWYVLATPETGIINEPLVKIGDYADELTTIKVNGLSAPLYGIGDYKDTLNLSTGVITRKIKKIVLTGDERWSENTSGTNTFRGMMSLSEANLNFTSGYCSHLVYVASGVSRDNELAGCNNGNLFLRLNRSIVDTISALKSYLAAQYAAGTPVTVWYVLAEPETETVSVPTGMTGEIEGYLTQISTPTPEHPSIPKWNGEEETGGTHAVVVYTPPEIPTTTGQNTLTVDTDLAPSSLTIKGHIREWQPENLLPVSKFEDLSDPSWWSGGYYIRYNNMPAGTYVMSTNMPEKDPGDVYFNGENKLNVPYEGRPVSMTINEGGSFYVLFFIDRGGYEKILDGTFVITLIKSE